MKAGNAFEEYVAKIDKAYRSGNATEHTYRGALTDLIAALLPHTTVLNEPKRIACGAPDLIITRAKLPVAFIEAKDIGDCDLDGRKAAGNKEQFDRYKSSLDHIAFTDYLDFHFYEKETLIESVRIADVVGEAIKSQPENFERFAALVADLGNAAPQKIKSATQLAKLMAGKARLLEQATMKLLEGKDAAKTSIGRLMDDFRRTLVPDVDAKEFADIYAQTITYGMFAARLHDDTPEDFTRYEAAALIPKSNPFLKHLFTHIASGLEDELVWIVDDLVTMFGASDICKIMKDYGKSTSQGDPMIHFYEDFLAVYDSGLRKDRGVWYTPHPVVKFIVRGVDFILQKFFGLPDGLATRDKVEIEVEEDCASGKKATKKLKKLVHKVQMLDPSTGTGTFLAECVNCIFAKFAGHAGKWKSYVKEDLLPRLNGFEILMASYTMAHVKLDMVLSNTGYTHAGDGRFNIFLTNSLEEHTESMGPLFAAALGEEANAAKFIKRDCPVMVVMGNPPYSGESQNKGAWIGKLMEDYKKEPGGKEKLKERNPKWLNDDYVKFIRYAQQFIERRGEGIVAYINPHGYLDNPTFRGMRWNLLKTFDDIYVVNLHGNSKRKETTPDGGKDENVFNIMQGVSINIFVKSHGDKQTADGKADGEKLATVRYCDVYGKRKDKLDWLKGMAFEKVQWHEVVPQAPMYFFVPKDFGLQDEYEKGFKLDELMRLNGMGITSAHDEFVIGGREALASKFSRFATTAPGIDLYKEFDVKPKSGWDIRKGYEALHNQGDIEKYIHPIAYRIFDDSYIFYEDNLVWRTVRKVFGHFTSGDNLGLCLIKICSRDDALPVFVTDKITDKTLLSSKDNANVFPLYLYEESFGKTEKKPNFNEEVFDKIAEALKRKPSPEEVFDYIYAVLHTPEYRSKYKEFLKVDFPRIPYPKSAAVFDKLVTLGTQLRKAHLLKDGHSQFENVAAFAKEGENVVEGVRFEDGRVFINATQYFDAVPEDVFNFYIGGYQPAQKWLKDRKGQTLTNDDCDHYQSIILALIKTSDTMLELSKLSSEWL